MYIYIYSHIYLVDASARICRISSQKAGLADFVRLLGSVHGMGDLAPPDPFQASRRSSCA